MSPLMLDGDLEKWMIELIADATGTDLERCVEDYHEAWKGRERSYSIAG